MIDKKKELRKLYEDALYWHLIHSGQKIKRNNTARKENKQSEE